MSAPDPGEGTQVWFVRHGQSTANAEGLVAGHRDVGLTSLGEEQARGLADVLAPLQPDRVVSSDLKRALETARIAWRRPEPAIERTAALRERHLGAWEGTAAATLRATGSMNRLITWDGRPPGGESLAMLARRVLTWLAAQDDGSSLLLFAHGGLIRSVVGVLDGTPVEQIGRWKVKNVEVVPRRVVVGTWARLLTQPALASPRGDDSPR